MQSTNSFFLLNVSPLNDVCDFTSWHKTKLHLINFHRLSYQLFINNPSSFFFFASRYLFTSPSVSLFLFHPQFLLHTKTISNIISPPGFFMSSQAFCPSITLACTFQKSSFQNVPMTFNRSIYLTDCYVFVDY